MLPKATIRRAPRPAYDTNTAISKVIAVFFVSTAIPISQLFPTHHLKKRQARASVLKQARLFLSRLLEARPAFCPCLHPNRLHQPGTPGCRSPPSDFDLPRPTQKIEIGGTLKINLRDYYPFYTSDAIVEVPDEVAALLLEYKRREEAQRIHTYRHKAFFSLDFGDNIECRALIVAPSPFEIIERRRVSELVYKAFSSLPDKQARRIYAHYFLGMSKAAIARAEGCSVNSVKESISRALQSLEKFLEENL